MTQRAIDDANEQKSLDAVKGISKKCPSASCGVNIEKISGCDHITCEIVSSDGALAMNDANFRLDLGQVCRHEFCWLCFASYAGPTGIRIIGNSAHQESCRYYSSNLPGAPTLAQLLQDPDDIAEMNRVYRARMVARVEEATARAQEARTEWAQAQAQVRRAAGLPAAPAAPAAPAGDVYTGRIRGRPLGPLYDDEDLFDDDDNFDALFGVIND